MRVLQAQKYVPDNYHTRCPISGLTMSDPVTDVEGINYERKNIEQWLQTQPQIGKSPASGKPLTKEDLWSNRELKNIIEERFISYISKFS